ncbi:MAG: T9SS type A sorting domain-containing protein [Candidatus Marinimicrobia bacterium]|nr:T9SS type A sorting domain-containing protein [Candidatus Neomarinimicrobiota bacterium]
MRLKASSHTPRDDNNIFDNFLPVCVQLRTGRRLSFAKLLITITLFSLLSGQSYNWPCAPFNQQHNINATFCECRSGSSGDIDHFHDAVDIHLSEGGAVYSVIDGTVESIGTEANYGINAWVRIGRYAYVHVDANPNLNVGDQVVAFETIIGWTNAWNHIHFKDGWPGSEINAIRTTGGLSPLVDEFTPTVHNIHFYIDGTQTEFQNNRIYGNVDIVCKATDHTDDGPIGDNNGIYKIGYEVFDSTGISVFGPSYPFWFSYKPSNSYINNVYAYGSSTSTYRYTISNNVSSNNSLNVSNWPLGDYLIRVVTFDHYMQTDTLEQWVEVVGPDEVAPAPPQILSIQKNGNGFALTWAQNTENDLAGYRLYFSYDGENWNNNHDESLLTNNMTEFIAPSFSNSLAFFKLTAVDNAPFPNESDPSDIFVFRKDQQEKSLIFIDAYYSHEAPSPHSFLKNAGLLSNDLNIGIQSIHQSLFSLDTSLTLSNNDIPIVFTGHSIQSIDSSLISSLYTQPFGVMGARSLEAFTQNLPGQLFLDSLGFTYGWMDDSLETVMGTGTPFTGENYSVQHNVIGLDSINSFSWLLDEYEFFPNLTVNENSVGVSSLTNPYLWTTIPLELISLESKSSYYTRAISFLLGEEVNISNDVNILPESLIISFYPNPFNGEGMIEINGQSSSYSINVYNVLGQIVFETNSHSNTVGIQKMKLPMHQLKGLSSGLFFLHVTDHIGQIATQKIIYLK